MRTSRIIVMSIAVVLSFTIGRCSAPEPPEPPDPTSVINNIIVKPKSMVLTITAYTNRIQETNSDNKNTATMERPVAGRTCAVSRDLIKWLGGRVYIEGIGVRRVNDLMNTRFEQSLDVYIGSVKEAIKLGKQRMRVVYLG